MPILVEGLQYAFHFHRETEFSFLCSFKVKKHVDIITNSTNEWLGEISPKRLVAQPDAMLDSQCHTGGGPPQGGKKVIYRVCQLFHTDSFIRVLFQKTILFSSACCFWRTTLVDRSQISSIFDMSGAATSHKNRTEMATEHFWWRSALQTRRILVIMFWGHPSIWHLL